MDKRRLRKRTDEAEARQACATRGCRTTSSGPGCCGFAMQAPRPARAA
jgi:hypothetical protein